MKTDVVVVGSGFAGSVIAERCAAAGRSVLVIDKRDHVGGNAFDEVDEFGILVHRYGPHIFHTNAPSVVEYLSRFTDWTPYEHRVLASVDGRLYPIPINRTTVNLLYGLSLDEVEISAFFANVREVREVLRTSEDVVLASVGRDLCDKFFRGYTLKQWGMDLSQLSPTVAARIPVRTNSDDRYFEDEFQKMPSDGYTKMFNRMLDHPNITVELGVNFSDIRRRVRANLLVYSGAIDEYYDFCFGRLPYRSLRFEHQHIAEKSRLQDVGTVNYPNDFDFTRITEFKHLTGQMHTGTSIVREYPAANGDPYYPIPRADNQHLYNKYRELAEAESNVIFVGRLAEYKYYNIDQVVARTLKIAERRVGVPTKRLQVIMPDLRSRDINQRVLS